MSRPNRRPHPTYDRTSEVPDEIWKFVRGSNNGTRAVMRLYEYENSLCLQTEDKEGGGEIWLDEDDLIDMVEQLQEVLDGYLARRAGR